MDGHPRRSSKGGRDGTSANGGTERAYGKSPRETGSASSALSTRPVSGVVAFPDRANVTSGIHEWNDDDGAGGVRTCDDLSLFEQVVGKVARSWMPTYSMLPL